MSSGEGGDCRQVQNGGNALAFNILLFLVKQQSTVLLDDRTGGKYGLSAGENE